MSFRSSLSVSSATERIPLRIVSAVFFLSAAAIADEIFLIRLLSLRFWPHFVPLILSQAMLGFGASGIAIHGTRRWIRRHSESVFAALVLLAAPSFELAYRVSLRIPFDPYILLWDPSSWPFFALFFLVLSIPFLLSGGVVGVPLACRMGDPGWVYGASFAGSAAGALLALPASSLLHTEGLLRVSTGLGIVGSVFVLTIGRSKRNGGRMLAVLGSLGVMILPPAEPALSPYKDLAVARRLPGARQVLRFDGPSGDVRILSASGMHVAPGLSVRFRGEVPAQDALYSDGELRGVLPVPDGGEASRYLSWVPEALPYHLIDRPRVLQFSLRGTEGILSAAVNGAASITIVEPARELASAVREWADDTGGLPGSPPVRIRVEAARTFLARTKDRFDLVEMSGISSISYATVGIHAAGETFLLTREGIDAAVSRVAPGGILSLSGWLKFPPRESIKILRTLREVLERKGGGKAAARILMVRGWGTFTIVARSVPFSKVDLDSAKRFCQRTGFTVLWPPGPGESRFPEEQALAIAVESALSGITKSERLFDLRPVTDDSPYFYRFLRPGAVVAFRRILGDQWVPFLEWGVLFLLLSLMISSAVSSLLILAPLLVRGSGRRRITASRAGYFACLGLAYMMVELSFLKFGILLVGHPFQAAVAAIGGFTFFSGAGSILSGSLSKNPPSRRMLFPAIAGLALAGYLFLAHASAWLLPYPSPVRLLVFLAASAPAAFLMGIPFPAGLDRLAEDTTDAAPFAWGINGFCSVVGASLASAGALWLGFRWTVGVGALLYLFAGRLFGRLGLRTSDPVRRSGVTVSGWNG